jgi:DNA-binding NarL/FixJ family response regulator
MEICHEEGISLNQLRSKGREAEMVQCRRLVIRALYNEGYDVRSIAEAVNRDRGTVHHHLYHVADHVAVSGV